MYVVDGPIQRIDDPTRRRVRFARRNSGGGSVSPCFFTDKGIVRERHPTRFHERPSGGQIGIGDQILGSLFRRRARSPVAEHQFDGTGTCSRARQPPDVVRFIKSISSRFQVS